MNHFDTKEEVKPFPIDDIPRSDLGDTIGLAGIVLVLALAFTALIVVACDFLRCLIFKATGVS